MPMSSNPKRRIGLPSPPSTWASRPTRRATSPARASAAMCCRHRRPSSEIADIKPHGVFLSNGPATRPPPTTSSPYAGGARRRNPVVRHLLRQSDPGPGAGLSTYKMVFGHRGINIPVIDHATGRVAVTAQNHGFALEGEAGSPSTRRSGPRSSATPAPTTAWSRASNSKMGARSRCSTTPRPPPAPTTPNYLFDSFVELMAGALTASVPIAQRHAVEPYIRRARAKKGGGSAASPTSTMSW